jgi:hypothetical protein
MEALSRQHSLKTLGELPDERLDNFSSPPLTKSEMLRYRY